MKQNKSSVKNIVACWEKGGVNAVKVFLNEVVVFDDTWASKIKKLIEEGYIKSVDEEIEIIAFNINLKNKLYNGRKRKEDKHTKDT